MANKRTHGFRRGPAAAFFRSLLLLTGLLLASGVAVAQLSSGEPVNQQDQTGANSSPG